MKRFRCLGCKLSDRPHWHADSARPALEVRYRPRGTGDGVVFDLGAAMGFPTRRPSETTRALLEVIAEEKAHKPGEQVRLGFPGILQRAAIRQVENSQGQRAEARRIAKESREQAALDRDAAWAKLLSAVGLLPLDAPGSIKDAAEQLERSRAEGWQGALAVLKKRRNVEASALYAPRKKAAGRPVKENLRLVESGPDGRRIPSIKAGRDVPPVPHRGRKKKH